VAPERPFRIALIRPGLDGRRASDAMAPLAFAALAAATPQDVDLALWDDRVERVPMEIDADLVALSVETFTARRAYALADGYRRSGRRVVLGGIHPTLAPDESAEHADSIVEGDADDLWGALVADARAGRLRRVYRSAGLPPLDGARFERRLFADKRYAPVAQVQFGRGCRFSCDFCSVHALYGSSIRLRPVAEVVDEVAAIEQRHLFFVDDNLFADLERGRELLAGLTPLRRRWACQMSLDVATDGRLVDALAAAGCVVAVVGFESLDERSLRAMGKGANLGRAYRDAVRRLNARGILVYGTFVFGYDDDTPASLEACLALALEERFFLANFNPLTPTPGTPLFERLRAEGRLLHDRWWLEPSYRYGQATFRPRGMTPEQLEQGCWRARREFNRVTAILRRACARQTHTRDLYRLGLFFAANWVSRREIRRKQGAPLGGAVAEM
jgi:radical SAM superfamily enzyme YgiQ (UPF0313 family)